MAAILGMRGTGSWDGTNVRPTNFRDKMLYLYPDSPSILTLLTGRLKSEATDDPKFTIFEKGLPPHRVQVDGNHAAIATDIALDDTVYGDPQDLFPIGSVVMCERTLEVMWVTDNTTADQITVARGKGSVAAAEINPAGTTDDHLLIIGSHHAEGANVPESVSFNPTERYNYTQDLGALLQ